MVKPYLSIKLKDPQNYYLEDEIIHCIGNLRIEKVLKEATLRISFKGRSSSYSNSTRHHFETIFTTEKDISISKYNTSSRLKKISEFEFNVQVPNGVTIPSYRYLEGSDGGKVEYMIEATLETAGFLKRSVQATHIIQVPLVGKININENGLERTRENSIRWPKNEENANTCILSAWIPHEGCMRGKDVTIRVELKQPKRYTPAESILFELVRQEIIASGRDSLPDMTKQLDDKIIQSDRVKIEVFPDIGDNRLIGMSQILVMSIPSNITPTIKENAKVMRLDYKIRVTAKIPGIDSGKDKELSINLPIVIGTTGVSAIYDSGFESSISQLNQENINGSDGSNSIANGAHGTNYYGAHGYHGPPPPMAGPGGFHMPDPMHRFSQPPQMYPPPQSRFVLNPQNLPYSPVDFNDRIEGMPVPDFGDITGYPPNTSNEALSPGGVISEGEINPQAFVYPPVSRYSTPFSNPGSPLYPPPGNENYRPLSPDLEEQNSTIAEITTALNELSPVSSIKRTAPELKPVPDTTIQSKPNTPTPPQTPGKPLVVDSPGWYGSKDFTPQPCANATDFEDPDDAVGSFTRSTTMKKKSLVYRIDPLDSLTSYPPLMYKNNPSNHQ